MSDERVHFNLATGKPILREGQIDPLTGEPYRGDEQSLNVGSRVHVFEISYHFGFHRYARPKKGGFDPKTGNPVQQDISYDPATGKEIPYVGKAGDPVEFTHNGNSEKETVVAVDQASAIAALPHPDAPHMLVVESVKNVSARSALLATDVRPPAVDPTLERDPEVLARRPPVAPDPPRGNRGAGWRAPKLKSLRGA